MSEIFAEQLTAVATAVLALFAIVTAWVARGAFVQQWREVDLLLEQNKRDTEERRKAQATRVFLATPRDEGNPVSFYVRNASDLPIHYAEIQYNGQPGSWPRESENLGTIMPGEEVSAKRQFPPGEASLAVAAFLTFRDAAGMNWYYRTDSGLSEWHPPPVPPESEWDLPLPPDSE
jgi:hypothetical protein